MQTNSDLMRRIVTGLYADIQQAMNGRGVVDWEAHDSEDDEGIEFRAETNTGGRGVILYHSSDSEVTLGLERTANDGIDMDLSSHEFPELQMMYDILLARNFDVEKMDIHDLIDFYFRMGE